MIKNTIIKIENLSKQYITKRVNVNALRNVNISFEKGKFYAIMGHSGSGKSTLIKILALLLDFEEGKYFIDGEDISSLTDIEICKIRSEKIGLIFQDYYLCDTLKAYENVSLPMLINNTIDKKTIKTKSENLLKKMRLENRLNHYPKEMSGGEKQRVAIARALANNPDIILADEPTGNLDEENEKKIFEILKSLSMEGKCIVVVSHSNVVKKYADKIYEINEGKIGAR